MSTLAEAFKDIDGPILPDYDHPFMVWVRECAETQLLLHEIMRKLDPELYEKFWGVHSSKPKANKNGESNT